MNTPRFHITPLPYGRGYELRFGLVEQDGTLIAAEPVTMRTYGQNEASRPEPMLSLEISGMMHDTGLQSLMDELWKVGIRPSDIGTPGHLAATQAHLEDMRALVKKQTGAELK